MKRNADFQGLIEIQLKSYGTQKEQLKEARKYAAGYRRALTKDYQVNNKQVTIQINKSLEKDAPTVANLYIVPKAVKNKN